MNTIQSNKQREVVRPALTVLWTAMLVVLMGCSSTVTVQDITDTKPGDNISGIPFRLNQAHDVIVYKRTAKGDYEQVFKKREILPDLQRLFAVGFDSQFLSDHELQLKVRQDGTLELWNLTSAIKVDEALTAITAQIKPAVEAITKFDENREIAELAKKKAKAERKTSLKDLEDASRLAKEADEAERLQLQRAAFDALMAVQKAEAVVLDLTAEATHVERISAENELLSAKYSANSAYLAVGLAEPYPGIFAP